MSESRGIAMVTGASSGIGAATARRLSAEGYHVVIGARRIERLNAIAREIGGEARPLDVTDVESVARFCDGFDNVNVLVNNAGGALGLEPVSAARDDHWLAMYETNVLGTMRMTRALLPALMAGSGGHVVTVTSIAGFEVYQGGAGYTAAKHAQRAVSETLRLELLGKPVRVTEIAPGLVETEFSQVRFDGDVERARNVYAGMKPLTAEDVADAIAWAVTRPSHVNIDTLVIRPLAQATATLVHRQPLGSETLER